MKRYTPFLLLSIFALTLASCDLLKKKEMPSEEVMHAGFPPVGNLATAKNVIFLVGDGMGLAQITGAMYANGNKLNLERFKTIGLHKTHASDKLITDSAAGATAFSCGIKTYNGAIGVKDDKSSCETVAELAKQARMSVGMVATSTIVHATPASFYAHQPQRKMYEEIAMDLANFKPDYFVGGGKKFFDRRDDEKDLIKMMQADGYTIGNYFDNEFLEMDLPEKGGFGFLTADEDPLPVAQGRNYLLSASVAAIPFLAKRSDRGFFLLIEGSQIDWGGHANDGDYVVSELLDFDRVVGRVLDYAEKDGNTLVVVTADHETGGYSNIQGSKMDSLVTKFTSGYHTATMVPVFAYGPGANRFSGIYDNTEIYEKLKSVLDL